MTATGRKAVPTREGESRMPSGRPDSGARAAISRHNAAIARDARVPLPDSTCNEESRLMRSVTLQARVLLHGVNL